MERARSVTVRATLAAVTCFGLVAGCSLVLDAGACSLQVFELPSVPERVADRRPISEPYLVVLEDRTNGVYVGFSAPGLEQATMRAVDPGGVMRRLIHIEGRAHDWQAFMTQVGVWHIRLVDETVGCVRDTSIRVTRPRLGAGLP